MALELRDDLKANFRSYEYDHDNEEDANLLAAILSERHPKVPYQEVREIVYAWVGYEPEPEE